MYPFKSINGCQESPITIRPIEPRDDMPLRLVLTEGCREFGAIGAGFGVNEHDARPLSNIYSAPPSAYFVMERDGHIAGGIDIAPLPCDLPTSPNCNASSCCPGAAAVPTVGVSTNTAWTPPTE
jgi:hypothetical protein